MLVKASAGGGGRGMRIVRSGTELADAVEGARREAGSAFGDDTVFLERYLEAPRHIEIQIFADTHGNVVSLFERECSIQRRHQKIVEEAPSPAVDDDLRQRMGEAAVAAAAAVGYVGAGTVEFVLAHDSDEFSFLEMNTRLQVEHPVTECITGLDLVRLQLLVAVGEPLPAEALSPRIEGHAIEVRLYAEDVAAGFLPATGTLRASSSRSGVVRVDGGFESGSVVSPYYDAMLAKVIAHAPTRDEAAATLATPCSERGFTASSPTATCWSASSAAPSSSPVAPTPRSSSAMTRRRSAAAPSTPEPRVCTPLIAALAVQAHNRATARVQAHLPSGWRNNPSQPQRLVLRSGGDEVVVTYAFGSGGIDRRSRRRAGGRCAARGDRRTRSI